MRKWTTPALSAVMAAFLSSATVTAAPNLNIIKKPDFMIVFSKNAEALGQFFTEKLGLPMAWPYEAWPPFMATGVYVGNIEIEFVNDVNGILPGVTHGLVLEAEDAATADRNLTTRGIAHAPQAPDTGSLPNDHNPTSPAWSLIDSYLKLQPQESGALWTEDVISGLLDPNTWVFSISYNFNVTEMKYQLLQHMLTTNANPDSLGWQRVEAITIHVKDLAARQAQWQALLSATPNGPWPTKGPFDADLHFVQADDEGITGIVVKVDSIEKAATYLTKRGIHFTFTPDRKLKLQNPLLDGLLEITLE